MQKYLSGIVIIFIISTFSAFGQDKQPEITILNHDMSVESLSPQEWEHRKRYNCHELLNYIYKEITLSNLEKSYDRLTKKLLLAYVTLYKNANKGKLSENMLLIYLTNSLKEMDPDFEKQIESHQYAGHIKKVWPMLNTYGGNRSFLEIVKLWKYYQETSPELFRGLESEFFLDKWDETSAGIINTIDELGPSNKKLAELQEKFKRPDLIAKGSIRHDPIGLKKEASKTQSDIMKSVNDIYIKNLDDYKHVCDQEDMDFHLLSINECRPQIDITKPNIEGILQLNEIANSLSKRDLAKSYSPPRILSTGKLDIKEFDYPVNEKGDYCIRNMEIVDTIVIHHTATNSNTSPLGINRMHMAKSTNSDKWHMIGYHYLIHGKYKGSEFGPEVSISRGRQESMVGAHTGDNIAKYSPEQREILENATLSCGLKGKEFKDRPIKETITKDGEINGNYGTIGISIVGNYEPKRSRVGGTWFTHNISGYERNKPRYASDDVLKKLAELMCDIQKRNPRVKQFRGHRFYKKTGCPGRIQQQFSKIKKITKELGCEFSY